MSRIYISRLKSELSKHLRAAEAGEVIEVMDRARPIARIVPIESPNAGLETVPPERPFTAVRKLRLPPLAAGARSLELLAAERGLR